MGLDYNGVGNHEFDEGITELLRMQYGNRPGAGYVPADPSGCHPVDGCGDGDNFKGADFQFLAANVTYKAGEPLEARRSSRRTPSTVQGRRQDRLRWHDARGHAPDRLAGRHRERELPRRGRGGQRARSGPEGQGVEAIVVLLHEGGVVGPGNGGPGTGGDPALINTCDNPRGDLPPIVQAMDDEIDVVITGHTNWAVNCVIDGKVVTGAASQGRARDRHRREVRSGHR